MTSQQRISTAPYRMFERSNALFSNLPGGAVAFLASVGSDIALLIDADGRVIDCAYQDASLESWGIDGFLGKHLRETVTPECYDKIDALLTESKTSSITRKRQVNHPADGRTDLPVSYSLVAIDGLKTKLALGEDFRKMADIQQRLIQTQLELETEYRKIREAEGRYRTIFQKFERPIIIINGETSEIMDLNRAAIAASGTKRPKGAGETISSLFAREHRDKLMDAINAARHGGTIKTATLRLLNGDHDLHASIEPYRENGATNLLISLTDESSAARVTADMARDDMLLDHFPEALVTTDSKGTIVEANDQFLDLVHVLNKNALVSRNLNNWLGGSNVDMQVLLTRLREENQVRQFSTIIRDELGETKSVLVSASKFHVGDQERVGLFITDNIRRDTTMTVPSPGAGENGDFAELVGRVPLKDLIREASDVIEKMCIEAALRQTENNRASAADMLGLSRQSLYIKLRRHGLENYDGTQ